MKENDIIKNKKIIEKLKCKSCEIPGKLEYYGKNIKYSYKCKNCGYINDLSCLFETKKI